MLIPAGFLTPDNLASDLLNVIANAEPYIFAVISSRLHYNTFPSPDISEKQKESLEDHVFQVLDELELYPEKTMAQLYDPDKMPDDGLRQAHHDMDMAVEQCYRKKPFESDEERLEYLFKLYEEMIPAECK